MGLTSALNNAFSGLSATSRRAELVSNNISNAMTDGFARREINFSAHDLNGFGGGVRVTDVTRIEHAVMSAARRDAEASVSSSAITADFVSRFAASLGNPEEPNSLAVQYSGFETSLIAAANSPSNEILLGRSVNLARDVSETLKGLSTSINELRLEADQKISQKVEDANSLLSQLSDLNTDIRTRMTSGGSTAALKDQRSNLLDQLNTIIPIKVAERDFGRIAIFTPSGGVLLDGRATQFSFADVPAMSHGMTTTNGALSDLMVDGSPVVMNSGNGFFDGGSLAGLFDARDRLLPQFNDEIDGLAADLITRFQSTAVDPSLTASDPGLFTDNGVQFVAGNELGLAGRIAIHSSIDPQQGGAVWRLRDGLNSVVQGDIGLNAILRNYLGAFQSPLAPSNGITATVSLSANGFAEKFSAGVLLDNVLLDDNLAFETSKTSELRDVELSIVGVDTDAELQNLMEVESAYAANARVVSVLDELINKLLEI